MEELLIEPALSGTNSAQHASQRIADQLALERAVVETRSAARADVTAKTKATELNRDGHGAQTGWSLLARPQTPFIGDAQAADGKQGQVRSQAQQMLKDAARATGIEPRAALDDTMKALTDPAVREIATDIAEESQRTARALAEAVALDDTAPVDADDTAATVATQQPVQAAAVSGADTGRTVAGDGVETDITDAVIQSQTTATAGDDSTGDDSTDTGADRIFPDILVSLPLGLGDPTDTPTEQNSTTKATTEPATVPPLVDLPLANGSAFSTEAGQAVAAGAVTSAAGNAAAPDAETLTAETLTAGTEGAAPMVAVAASDSMPSPEALIQLPLTNGPAFKPTSDPRDSFLRPQGVERPEAATADDTAAPAIGQAAAARDRDSAASKRDADTDGNPIVELPLSNDPNRTEKTPSRAFLEAARDARSTGTAGSPQLIVELPLGGDLTEPAGGRAATAAAVAASTPAPDPLVALPLTNGPAFKIELAEDLFWQNSIKASLGYAGKTIQPGTPAAGLPVDAEQSAADPGRPVPLPTDATLTLSAVDGSPAPTAEAAKKDDAEISRTVRGPLAAGAAVLLNEYDPQAPTSPRIPAGGLTASLNKLSADGIAPGNTLTDAG